MSEPCRHTDSERYGKDKGVSQQKRRGKGQRDSCKTIDASAGVERLSLPAQVC
jgi:hypothetical protein